MNGTKKRDKKFNPDDVLTERQQLVVEIIKMRLSDRHALEYLAHYGYVVSEATLTRDKRKVEGKKMDRLFQVAKMDFEEHHLDRIDNTEIALKLMWQNYHGETNGFKRVLILEKIVAVQPYLSSFYEVTKHVLENNPVAKMKWEALENLKKESTERYDKAVEMIRKATRRPDDVITYKDEYDQNNNNNNNGLQHIDQQYQQEDNDIPDHGEGDRDDGETEYERTGLSEGEEVYRRQKDRAIF